MDSTFALSTSQPSSSVSASVSSIPLLPNPLPPPPAFSVPIPSQQLLTSATLAPSDPMDVRWSDLDLFELAPSLSLPALSALPTITSAPPHAPPTNPSDDLTSISLLPSTILPPVSSTLPSTLPSTPTEPVSSSPLEHSTSASTPPHSTFPNLAAFDFRLDTSALPSILPTLHQTDSSSSPALHMSPTSSQPVHLTKSHHFYHDHYLNPRRRIHKQTRRYTAPKSSRYCHLCARHQRSVSMVPCGNVQLGLCQKSVCTKCIAAYGLDVRGPNWACPHCCNSCPQRAKCFSYDRQTARRREKTLIAKLNSALRNNSTPVHPSRCVMPTPAHVLRSASSS